jgi:hypothetical protein
MGDVTTLLRDVSPLVDRIRPLLAGHEPAVQGAVLADLLAIWLAGHLYPGDAAATAELREDVLRMHIEAVRALVPLNAAIIGTADG